MLGAVEHRGGLDRAEGSAPGCRIQGRGRAAVPAGRVESLDWTLVGGRRQLLRLLGVDVRSCNQHRAFLERGQVLARCLSEELGSHHRVTYQGDGCIPEREMLPVSFFAVVLEPGNPRDRPAGLVRRIHTAPVPTDESLHRDLQWHPSEYLRRYWLGHNELDHVEISEEEAEAVIAHWREHGVAWRPGD